MSKLTKEQRKVLFEVYEMGVCMCPSRLNPVMQKLARRGLVIWGTEEGKEWSAASLSPRADACFDALFEQLEVKP